MLSELMVSDII